MKKTKQDVIFRSNRQLHWKDLKNIILQDDDEIVSQWVEPYYSENNSWDGHHESKIIRKRLETDEEEQKRENNLRKRAEDNRKAREKDYLELKKEFEKDDSVEFMNWTLSGDCVYTCSDEDQWNDPDYMNNRKTITTKELYEVFKKRNES